MSLKEALDYGKYGWKVFPILPRSKAPACSGGFHDAVKDEAAIRALWGNRTNLNLGIATGEASGFWVLDIDADKGGTQSLEELENKYGSLPETLISFTGGGGKHYLFKIPANTKISCTIGKIAKGIDTRGNGGYIAAPPSIHPNGAVYTWGDGEIAEAPKWLVKLISDLKNETIIPSISGQVVGDWTNEDVLSMLEVISPDERETWINVGMALNEGGWPVTMWDTWSRASEKYKMGEPFRIWKGFKAGGGISMGTLVHMAQDRGWTPKDKPYEELDFSNVNGVDLSAFKAKITKPVLPDTETKISIGGLVGDTLSWINSTAFQLQPELTIMNILAALGAVFGRRYALQQLDTRTNIYLIGIAGTSQGKDNSRKRIKRLLNLAGLDNFSGPDSVRSMQGLLLELEKRPSLLVNIDEIGMFMRGIYDPKAPAYIRDISTMFTRLYSDSTGSYDGGLIASQPDKRTVLYEPNLCIYGTTTLSSYSEAMKSSAIKSGELNRFIVIKPKIDFPEANENCGVSDPPEDLISRWGKFKVEGLGAAPSVIEQEKIIVKLGETDKILNKLMKDQIELVKTHVSSGMGDLWGRYRENIIKVSMIVAIARDPAKPVLIPSDIEFGKTLVTASINFMLKFVEKNMYDGEFQKRCLAFMEALGEGATNRTMMIRRLQIKARELDEIERALQEMGKIDFDPKEKPKKYILI